MQQRSDVRFPWSTLRKLTNWQFAQLDNIMLLPDRMGVKSDPNEFGDLSRKVCKAFWTDVEKVS